MYNLYAIFVKFLDICKQIAGEAYPRFHIENVYSLSFFCSPKIMYDKENLKEIAKAEKIRNTYLNSKKEIIWKQ